MPDTLPARTARTITNPEMLRLHLDEIARRGYAVDDEENDPGVRCISAPVFTPSGEPFACVGIDGPSVRMPPEKDAIMAEFVTAAATDLTARLVDAASHIGASTAR
jgi:IclR family acetate operon transcriptional repressor